MTKGEFSLLDLVRAILQLTGPADVTVATWTPGASEMDSVCDLLRTGQISHFRLLVDRSFPTRQPQYIGRMKAILPSTDIRMTRTHAKFALIQGDGWHICVRTSMNFNANPRFEQFDLDDDPKIFAFFDGLVDSLFASIPAGLDVPGATINSAFSSAFRAPAEVDPVMNTLALDSGALAALLGIK
jgi:hypothetical protein